MARYLASSTAQEPSERSTPSNQHDNYGGAVSPSCTPCRHSAQVVRGTAHEIDSDAARAARIAALSRLYGVVVSRAKPVREGPQEGLCVDDGHARCQRVEYGRAGDVANKHSLATSDGGAALAYDPTRDAEARRTTSMPDVCQRSVYRHRAGLDYSPYSICTAGRQWSIRRAEDEHRRRCGGGCDEAGSVVSQDHLVRGAQSLSRATYGTTRAAEGAHGTIQPARDTVQLSSSELLVLGMNAERDASRVMQARELWTRAGRHLPEPQHSTCARRQTVHSSLGGARSKGAASHGETPVMDHVDVNLRHTQSLSLESIQVRDDDDSVGTAATSGRHDMSAVTPLRRCSLPTMSCRGALCHLSRAATCAVQPHTYLVLTPPEEAGDTRPSTASRTHCAICRPPPRQDAHHCHDDEVDTGSTTRRAVQTASSFSAGSEGGIGHDGLCATPVSGPPLPRHVPHAPPELRHGMPHVRALLSQRRSSYREVASTEAVVVDTSSEADERAPIPALGFDENGGAAETPREGGSPRNTAATQTSQAAQPGQEPKDGVLDGDTAMCVAASVDTGVLEAGCHPDSSNTAGRVSSVELQTAYYRGQCSTIAVWQEQERWQFRRAEQEDWDDLQRRIFCEVEQAAREAIVAELATAARENAAQLDVLYAQLRTDLVVQAAQAHDKLLHDEQGAFSALHLSAATQRAAIVADEVARLKARAAETLCEQRDIFVRLLEAAQVRRVDDLLSSEAAMRALLRTCALTELCLEVRAAVYEEQQLARDALLCRAASARRAWLVSAVASVPSSTQSISQGVQPRAAESSTGAPAAAEATPQAAEPALHVRAMLSEDAALVTQPASSSCAPEPDSASPAADSTPSSVQGDTPSSTASAREVMTAMTVVRPAKEEGGKVGLPLMTGTQVEAGEAGPAVVGDVRGQVQEEAPDGAGEREEGKIDKEDEEDDLSPTIFDNIVMKPHGPVSALMPQARKRMWRDDRVRHAARLTVVPPTEDEDSLFGEVEAAWRDLGPSSPSTTLAPHHRGQRLVPVDEPMRRVPPHRSRPKAPWFEDNAV